MNVQDYYMIVFRDADDFRWFSSQIFRSRRKADEYASGMYNRIGAIGYEVWPLRAVLDCAIIHLKPLGDK